MKTITAQDLYNLTKCHHRVYLDSNGNPQEKGEVGSFVKLLWELGLQTEREYIESLGEMPVVDLGILSVEQGFQETLRLMKEGVPLIYQGCLIDGPYVGRPDLLFKRDEGESRFGPYLYEAIDIKAGKGWEGGEGRKPKFKEHYAFQIMFYRMLLERIQGAVVAEGRIINVDKQIEAFDPMSFALPFQSALEEATQLVYGQETSEPVLGSQCLLCEWFGRCHRWVKTHDDPSGLFFVGKQKFRLKEVGLRTIHDIAKMEVSHYLSPANKIPRMGEKALTRMKQRAGIMLSGKPWVRQGYFFPQTARDIYFDIEDDPTQGLTYLFGLAIHDHTGPPVFRYFVARDPTEEEQTVRAFWEFIASAGDVTYYVYSHKERSSLRQLMERYELDPDVFTTYVEREYDLYSDLIVNYSDWPTFSYSIKQIAKHIGFHWRDTDPSGANSIAWYNEYLAHPEQEHLLTRILQYNEDDCLAMLAIKQFFERKAQEAQPENERC
ncbi:TM0106 family RecB-like putative nuclease [Candidatus Nitronereus thalassa]|uniref:TM0106 family RecB-like putative nuclease n=1 Tax=Candidatus Nitronereus thalassa TaxID=3020898 RepID=A0ABU3K9S6_9BACT|nr:TM0106 family RecB-like putative nuclease [Candidatus Nitronereus thalassa]MDT7043175.1 TM0106 family RecB-like putative nuclease [Candidatus Nitronereus thalassa]